MRLSKKELIMAIHRETMQGSRCISAISFQTLEAAQSYHTEEMNELREIVDKLVSEYTDELQMALTDQIDEDPNMIARKIDNTRQALTMYTYRFVTCDSGDRCNVCSDI
jgi:hypothetical protein